MKLNANLPFSSVALLPLVVMLSSLSACVVAPTSPMVSFGGPQPIGKYTPELTVASGAGMSISDKARGSEMAWYGRFRFGITDKLDIGAESLGFRYNNHFNLMGKLSVRYSFLPWLRADIGGGMGDNSYGRSASGDVGLTIGTASVSRVWNPYGTVRYGFAYSMKGTGLKPALDVPLGRLLNAHTVMFNIGAGAKLNPYIYFLSEIGIGEVIPVGDRKATIIYLSGGFSFRLPNGTFKKKSVQQAD